MRITKLFFTACIVSLLSGCFGFQTLVNPSEFVSTSNIVMTDSGRLFVSTEKGLFEIIDSGKATTRLVTEGIPSKGPCSFFGLKAKGDSLYAACVYTDNPPTKPLVSALTPPILGPLAPKPKYLSSALFHITLKGDDQYTVTSGTLPSAFLPRNLAVLDNGTVLVTSTERGMFGLDPGTSIYSTVFRSMRSTDTVQALKLTPWNEKGIPHSLLIQDNAVYLSNDSGISIRKHELTENNRLGASQEIYKTEKLHTARVISNLSLFEDKLVITEESFTGPLLSNSQILIMNEDMSAVETTISIPGNIVASNAALTRDTSGNIVAYVVSFYNGGVYKITPPEDKS